MEITVDAVDYRTGPGQDDKDEPEKVNVEVTHLVHKDGEPKTFIKSDQSNKSE